MLGAVSFGTVLHIVDTIFRLRTGQTLRQLFPAPQVIDFVENFSFFRSVMNLITIEETKSQIRASEIIKLVMIVVAIGNQAAFMIDISVGMNVIRKFLVFVVWLLGLILIE